MPYSSTDSRGEGIRTWAEAWDLALDHKGMMYQLLYSYVRKHSLPWYSGDDLKAELESYAWEGFFDACRRWDESKGYTLSTYAYPAVTNAMNARMKVLSRMGTSMQGHNVKGQGTLPRPALDSIEAKDEHHRDTLDMEGDIGSISDLFPQPWTDFEPLMEDVVVDAIYQAERVAEIRGVVQGMSEPHKTLFELMFLTPPTHDRPINGGRGLGSGYTLREAADKFGRSTTWAKEILDEAIEYIRYHLDAEGE